MNNFCIKFTNHRSCRNWRNFGKSLESTWIIDESNESCLTRALIFSAEFLKAFPKRLVLKEFCESNPTTRYALVESSRAAMTIGISFLSADLRAPVKNRASFSSAKGWRNQDISCSCFKTTNLKVFKDFIICFVIIAIPCLITTCWSFMLKFMPFFKTSKSSLKIKLFLHF